MTLILTLDGKVLDWGASAPTHTVRDLYELDNCMYNEPVVWLRVMDRGQSGGGGPEERAFEALPDWSAPLADALYMAVLPHTRPRLLPWLVTQGVVDEERSENWFYDASGKLCRYALPRARPDYLLPLVDFWAAAPDGIESANVQAAVAQVLHQLAVSRRCLVDVDYTAHMHASAALGLYRDACSHARRALAFQRDTFLSERNLSRTLRDLTEDVLFLEGAQWAELVAALGQDERLAAPLLRFLDMTYSDARDIPKSMTLSLPLARTREGALMHSLHTRTPIADANWWPEHWASLSSPVTSSMVLDALLYIVERRDAMWAGDIAARLRVRRVTRTELSPPKIAALAQFAPELCGVLGVTPLEVRVARFGGVSVAAVPERDDLAGVDLEPGDCIVRTACCRRASHIDCVAAALEHDPDRVTCLLCFRPLVNASAQAIERAQDRRWRQHMLLASGGLPIPPSPMRASYPASPFGESVEDFFMSFVAAVAEGRGP